VSCGKKNIDLCNECLSISPSAERESAKWIFPIFDYRHPPIKKALWLLKYKNKKTLAKIFAEILHSKILEELSDMALLENFTNPLLIPIPISKKRYRERGYNQSLLVCKELIRIDKENFDLESSVLIKNKETEHQARIKNRNERLKNIIGSFETKNENKIKNRNIILIDDITTTGATLNEAKKILKESGAKKIIAFTVAH
jgi:ComF family protein